MSTKKLRRIKWSVKKSRTKSILFAITVCCVLVLFANYYNDCSAVNVLPSFLELNRCKANNVDDSADESIDIYREKLNVSLLSASSSSSLPSKSALHERQKSGANSYLKKRMMLVVTAAEIESGSSNLQPVTLPQKKVERETDTEFPLEMVFEERKETAQKSCKDMLNVALAKENEGVELNVDENEQSIEFSVGHPGRRVPKKPFYNQDMLQIMRLHNKPKYFKGTIGVKRNRWIHFHRIIQSPISPKYNKVVEITWCPIFKAASTPWLAVFTKLSKALTNTTEAQIKRGKLGFMELARMFRLLTPRIYEKNVHATKYTMVVARHPFKRLLSAYRDKIERVKGRLYYYNKYSTKILTRYRQGGGVVLKKYKDPDYSVKVPTFEEFVRYILSYDPKKWDEHWRPMYLDCNPCYRTFDFILKVETLNDDKDKVLQYLHLSQSDPLYKEVEDVWVRWNNPSGQTGSNRTESFYYSQLTTADIQKLYELYEPDFQIFDYSPDAYFTMTKDDEQNYPTIPIE